MVKETFNAKETFEAGYEMGKKALPGQIYCLNGDLGVGKTVFTPVSYTHLTLPTNSRV